MVDSTAPSLLKSLQAYVSSFEAATTPEELSAIASSILTFQQKQGSIAIAPAQYEDLVQQAVNQFSLEKTSNSIVDATVDATTAALVQNVSQWRQELENQVLNTLNAYVQQFQADQIPDLPKTVLSILPLIENTQLRKSEVESLIQKVTAKFKFATALEQVVGAESIAIAQQLSQLLPFGNLEDLLTNSILDDQQLLNQPLENITESFVNSKLSEILGGKALEVDIDLNAQQLMVQQVTFKLNALKSSPPPAKSDVEIAKQVDDETQRFLTDRQGSLNFNNLFQT